MKTIFVNEPPKEKVFMVIPNGFENLFIKPSPL
jgi:hypothetical protein